MSNVVSYCRSGDIAVESIDSPPVNAVNQSVRTGLKQIFTEPRDKAAVKAIVLGCAGKTFIAGTDIKEFATNSSSSSRPLIPNTGSQRSC